MLCAIRLSVSAARHLPTSYAFWNPTTQSWTPGYCRDGNAYLERGDAQHDLWNHVPIDLRGKCEVVPVEFDHDAQAWNDSRPRQPMPNARLWVLANGGWVKVTLRPGQALVHQSFTHTDEGWRSKFDGYSYDLDPRGADEVIHDWSVVEQDCDGKVSRAGTSACAVACLATGVPASSPTEGNPVYGKTDRVPSWRGVDSSYRDHAAEAAGH